MRLVFFRLKFGDKFRFIKALVGYFLLPVSLVLLVVGDKKRSLKIAMKSHRQNYDRFSFYLINSNKLFVDKDFRSLASPPVGFEEACSRFIVIRWPDFSGDEEVLVKGVVVITFTTTFSFFLREINLRMLSKYFSIVLEPSSAGYADPDILLWEKEVEGDVWVQASEERDRAFLSAISTKLIPVSFGASDWVDHGSFYPMNVDKKYDSVYVANTNPVKRVYRYLEAIRRLTASGESDYRAALVCARWGGREGEVRKMIEDLDLSGQVDLKFGLNKEELNRVLNESKVNILLSRKEGSNRSLFEAMFSGTPVIALRENIGVNKAYINEWTGLLINDWQLECALKSMRDIWSRFAPRQWAMNHIAPEVTTLKLSRLIGGSGPAKKLDGISSFLVKTNNPEVNYLGYTPKSDLVIRKSFLDIFMVGADCDEVPEKLRVLAQNLHGIISYDLN